MRGYLVEITAIVDNLGTPVTLRYASQGFTTSPTDTPANAHYEERLKQPALVRRDMYSSSRTFGSSRVGFGELVLSNADGGLDEVKDYGFDGQPLVLKVGDIDGDFASFVTVLTGTIEQAELTQRELTFRVRDRQQELDEPIQPLRYLGTGDLEGTGLTVQGRVKPLLYGQAFNFIPIPVDTVRRIYHVAENPIADIQFVYDRGVALTRATPDYPDEATLLSTPPAAGEYRVFEGYFRLGARPTGVITCDAVEGALPADRTTAQVLKRLALQVGIDAGDIDPLDVSDLDSLNSAEVGIWIGSDSTALAAMDAVAASIGAYFGFDQNGIFRLGRLDAPVGLPIVTIDENLIIGSELERKIIRDEGNGIPAYQINLEYAKNYTLQNQTILAPVVLEERIAELSKEYRAVTATDSTVLNKHKLSPEIDRTTLLISKLDAEAEAARLLGIYSVTRELYEVVVRLEDELISQLDIGEEIEIVYRRFALDLGKTFILIGLEVDYQLNRASMTLWG